MVKMLTALMISGIFGCTAGAAPNTQTISVGRSDQGYLLDATPLPDLGQGYRRVRPGEGTRYGTATLIEAIERAALAVDEAYPGGYPLRVGDLSGPRGGAHERHRSHRAGRDADLLYYVRDAGGLPARGVGWMGFDRFGLAIRSTRAFAFDEARNWHLVKTLLLDSDARVKWLFCSNDIKTRLLRYAARHEPSAKAVLRATWVLHQPRGDPHADHFHVRVGCAPAERALGCREQPPFWPWQHDAASKADGSRQVAATDAQLVDWLLAEQRLDERGDVTRLGVRVAAQPTAVARGDLD
ncbi:MAG: penicillin-insensitive murein endopeptidase [Polyangiales bacterium]